MALYYWGINQGQTEFQVVAQATTAPGKNIQVSVDSTKDGYPTGITKEEMVRDLQYIINNIIKGNWPPA